VLLVERPEANPWLSAHVLAQPQPGADFELFWRSSDEPLWSIQAAGSRLELVESETDLLPEMLILAPLAMQGNLRSHLKAPDVFLEQAPYGRQWAETRWRFLSNEDAVELGGASRSGYNLLGSTLRSTPLTSLSSLLGYLRDADVGDASNYVARFDLLQQAYDLGLGEPGRGSHGRRELEPNEVVGHR
jgi:hypothetical protein